MAPYSVQQMVAASCTEALVAFRVLLPAPSWEVVAIQKTVLVDRADVTLGSALLRGRLRACYTVASAPGPVAAHAPPTVWHGPLTCVWAEAEVHVAIPVPEAQPDHTIEVTAAHVAGQAVSARTDGRGLIQGLDDQSLIQLAVHLTRTVDLHTIPAAAAQLPTVCAPLKKSAILARFDTRFPPGN